MEVKRDYYEILGINKEADIKTIKKAYRKLAKKYHPDTNAGSSQAEKRFKEVTEAYTILSDPKKRELYDRFGHKAFDGSMGEEPYKEADTGGYFHPGSENFREYHFEGNMDDIFEDFFNGMFHSERHSDFGGAYFRSGFDRRGEDLRAQMKITFEEAALGCVKNIQIQGEHGTETLQVRIPAGIENGKSIRLKGKGRSGRGTAIPGDLLIRIEIEEKPGYERRGCDIYTSLSIPFTVAVFGGEIPVDTFRGRVICKIPAGIQSGTKIRFAGRGIASMDHPGSYGDYYVSIQIQVPRKLNAQALQKLREFEMACKNPQNGGRSKTQTR